MNFFGMTCNYRERTVSGLLEGTLPRLINQFPELRKVSCYTLLQISRKQIRRVKLPPMKEERWGTDQAAHND
jgi:hypothetical protein